MENSASFVSAYNTVMKHEGGYADNPDDTGIETYCGISRRFHPDWSGWKHIDSAKVRHGRIKNNTIFEILSDDVMDFYRLNYWEKIKGDFITDTRLTLDIFDTAVNCGTETAGKFLQRALNILNNRQRFWEDLKVDGMIGSQTTRILDRANFMGKASLLHTAFTIIRGAHYIKIMERHESQEQFAAAWLNRLWIKTS